MSKLRLLFDRFTLALITVVAVATILPVHGQGALFFEHATTAAIALLFFLHGAKLSRRAIIEGAMHWRLHGVIFIWTFVVFPLLGWALGPLLRPLLGEALYMGVIYLCVLPGTVQSAIAFTSIARGNIPAAVCAASASSILGIVLTPLLLQLLLQTDTSVLGGSASLLDAIGEIGLQIFLPFVVGHLMRPLIGGWMSTRASLVRAVDQGSILLVVYTAFSASVVAGLWKSVGFSALSWLVLVCILLLAIVLSLVTWSTRRMGFSREDEITIVFCSSKKSLANGVPMAGVLFGTAVIGPVLLPLMLFHQIQLMVCAVLAQHYLRQDVESTTSLPG
ncbi:bile acid:sodium symporter [Bradymonadaceae bacterium TMQ3]|uniref:Bile acid:sodium symporter n=1 Tax=Lujinxingia sediminis TaxID=2480984 RepID=A0ABY0CZD4_9DELT|nr:bile acid:sodium symporter [Bradymonadaceae bacterium TMQ3]RVU48994.1 bile acid:sodium symporter [Lujinxingia sediminis]TXC78287.1 bile acid:sodium symporter [Bradymonadales bacterium TMQ1]